MLCVVRIVFEARSTRAQDKVEAIVSHGIELRRLGRDSEALVEFQRALKQRKTPRIRAQVAVAEQALGLWAAAEADLLEAMKEGKDEWIVKNRLTLVNALKEIQEHLGSLEVWGSPVGARIVVNEKVVGTLPLVSPVRLSEDTVALRAEADGYFTINRTVRVKLGETAREHVELIRVAAAPAPRAMTEENRRGGSSGNERERPPMNGEGEAVVTRSTASPEPPVRDKAPDDRVPGGDRASLRPYAWVAAGGAVAGIALGVVETVIALDKKSEFENHIGPSPADKTVFIKDCGSAMLSAACRPIEEAHNRALKLSIVGYAVGGALAAGSVVLFLLSGRGEPGAPSAVACLPDFFHPGVACQLRF
ncbi:MAG: PEGA domain-containing protein [Polyangia bacterium]